MMWVIRLETDVTVKGGVRVRDEKRVKNETRVENEEYINLTLISRSKSEFQQQTDSIVFGEPFGGSCK